MTASLIPRNNDWTCKRRLPSSANFLHLLSHLHMAIVVMDVMKMAKAKAVQFCSRQVAWTTSDRMCGGSPRRPRVRSPTRPTLPFQVQHGAVSIYMLEKIHNRMKISDPSVKSVSVVRFDVALILKQEEAVILLKP